MCGLLIARVLEVMLFGWAYCGLINGNGYGALVGGHAADIAECTDFSCANYTSLGYGDLVPLGPLRLMAGMEALTGPGPGPAPFVAFAWTVGRLIHLAPCRSNELQLALPGPSLISLPVSCRSLNSVIQSLLQHLT